MNQAEPRRLDVRLQLNESERARLFAAARACRMSTDRYMTSITRQALAQERAKVVNLSRAKDAAVRFACPRGLGDKIAHWDRRETPAEAPLVRSSGAEAA